MVPQYADDYYYDDPDESEKAPNRSWMVSLSLATILALIVIGETIGGLINVNNRTPVEFGQGVVLTVPCDQNGITVKPVAEYKENVGSKDFLFDSLYIYGISDQCLKRLFQLKFYNLSGPPLVIGYNNIDTSTSTQFNADAVRFLLSRKLDTKSFPGLNWYVYDGATELGSPPAPPRNNPSGPSGEPVLCGGDSNGVPNINNDFGIYAPVFGCLNDGWLSHMQGYLTIPGTDDGNTQFVKFTVESHGNTELWIDGVKLIADNSTRSTATSTSSSLTVRRGQSYLIDYWTFKPSGSSSAKLKWNLNGSGVVVNSDNVIDESYFYTGSLEEIEIAPTEGKVDYIVTPESNVTNNRAVKIKFARKIEAGQLQFISIETF